MLSRLPKQLVGHAIRGIRARLNMSQSAFAAALGMPGSGSLVSSWERGKAQPDYGTLAKIATMGVVDALVFNAPPPVEGEGLTAREMAELHNLLRRMEMLLGEARAIVDAASQRTLPPPEGTEIEAVVEIIETRPAAESDGEARPARKRRSGSGGKTASKTESKPKSTRPRAPSRARSGARAGTAAPAEPAPSASA